MNLLPWQRRLFEEDYIDNGCEGTFPPGTNVDDTIGTYSTNYLVAAVAFWGALLLMTRHQQMTKNNNGQTQTTSTSLRRMAVISHLVFFSIGFTLAGVGHQVVDNTETHKNGDWISVASYASIALSLPGLVLGLSYKMVASSKKRMMVLVLGLALSVVVLAVASVGSPRAGIVLVGFFLGVIQICLLLHFVYYLWWVKKHHDEEDLESLNRRGGVLLWGIALIAGIAGLSIQIALAPLCGSSTAYKNCFHDCPLPLDMNHNFLYHLLQAMSTLLLAMGALMLPKEHPTTSGEHPPQQEQHQQAKADEERGTVEFAVSNNDNSDREARKYGQARVY